jgi:hypothetical protein
MRWIGLLLRLASFDLLSRSSGAKSRRTRTKGKRLVITTKKWWHIHAWCLDFKVPSTAKDKEAVVVAVAAVAVAAVAVAAAAVAGVHTAVVVALNRGNTGLLVVA